MSITRRQEKLPCKNSRSAVYCVTLANKLRSYVISTTKRPVRFGTALTMTTIFFIAEIASAHLTNSVALSADAFFMLSDITALSVSLAVALRARKPTERSTFGFLRAEIVGTLVNTVLVSSMCLMVMFQSVRRLFQPERVENVTLLILIASVGLLINALNIFVMRLWPALVKFFLGKSGMASNALRVGDQDVPSEKQNNLTGSRLVPDFLRGEPVEGAESAKQCTSQHLHPNFLSTIAATPPISVGRLESIRLRAAVNATTPGTPVRECIKAPSPTDINLNSFGALLNIATDMMGSAIVLISSVVTRVFYKGQVRHWTDYVDPLLSIVMCVLVLPSALRLLKNSALTLMEVLPPNVSIKDMISDIMTNVPRVIQIHNIHVWKFIDDRVIATLHVVVDAEPQGMATLNTIKKILASQGVHLCTIQLEHFNQTEGINADVCRPEELEAGGCLLSPCLSRCTSESVFQAMNQFATTRQEFNHESVIVVEDYS